MTTRPPRARGLLPLVLLPLLACTPRPADDDGDDDDAADFDPSCLPEGVSPSYEPHRAELLWISDGDTAGFLLDDGREETVRFLSIDTPEVRHGSTPAECYGDEAETRLRELLPSGSTVWLTAGPTEYDLYDRLLAYVFVGEAPSCDDFDDWVNLRMVREGFACEFVWSNNRNWEDTFVAAEREARNGDAGLWGDCRDPWELCGP